MKKLNVKKLTDFIIKRRKDAFSNILNFAEERTVKLNLLIILKTLNPSIVLNTKKKIWLIQKENINYVQNVNLLIKQNVLQKCKYTIQKYKTASKYMKLKTIDYLKETKQEFYLCRICGEIVSRSHFDSEDHIKKFNSVISIDINKSFENAFITIKCQLFDTRYNYIYTDLYFKKHIKDIILKNIDDTKYYKSYIIKKNMLNFNYNAELHHYTDKFISNNIISDINNIENLEKNDEYMKPYLIKTSTDEYDYNIDKMYEDLDKVNFIKSGNSITYIHNMGVNIKISECELLRGASFENIPKIFYDSKMINIIKNKDLKCFLYCYIRKFLNPVKK